MQIMEFEIALLFYFVFLGMCYGLKGHYWGFFAVLLILVVDGGVFSGGITYGNPVQTITVDTTLFVILLLLTVSALLIAIDTAKHQDDK